MTRNLRGVSALLARLAAGVLWFLAPFACARELAPFRTGLVVSWGGGAGSDAFRDDLSRVLAEVLATECFSGVVIVDRDPAPAATDLVFTVVLSEVVDETRFDDSIASTLAPGEPDKELRRVARFAVTVDATLSVRSTGTPVRTKHLVAGASRRPAYVGEDPQATARRETIDGVVVDLAKGLGCGGAKLLRKIRDALGNAEDAAPRPR